MFDEMKMEAEGAVFGWEESGVIDSDGTVHPDRIGNPDVSLPLYLDNWSRLRPEIRAVMTEEGVGAREAIEIFAARRTGQ